MLENCFRNNYWFSFFPLSPYLISETPSINRVLPVISPTNFLLTSRGRVVYGLLTIDKQSDAINEYLSDEFRQAAAGNTSNYTESDVEKVKIDSLAYRNVVIEKVLRGENQYVTEID